MALCRKGLGLPLAGNLTLQSKAYTPSGPGMYAWSLIYVHLAFRTPGIWEGVTGPPVRRVCFVS